MKAVHGIRNCEFYIFLKLERTTRRVSGAGETIGRFRATRALLAASAGAGRFSLWGVVVELQPVAKERKENVVKGRPRRVRGAAY